MTACVDLDRENNNIKTVKKSKLLSIIVPKSGKGPKVPKTARFSCN